MQVVPRATPQTLTQSLSGVWPLPPANPTLVSDQFSSFESLEGHGLSPSTLPYQGSSALPAFSPATSAAAEQTHTPFTFTSPCHWLQLHPPRHPPGRLLRGAQLPGFQFWLQPLSSSMAFPKLCNLTMPQSLLLYNGNANSSPFPS